MGTIQLPWHTLTIPAGKLRWRWTTSGTLLFVDEFRSMEWLGPSGGWVCAWIGSTIKCDVPRWIRRVPMVVLAQHRRPVGIPPYPKR